MPEEIIENYFFLRYFQPKIPMFWNLNIVDLSGALSRLSLSILRGGNAETWNFNWVIVPPKFGCVVVEWILGFNKKYSKFHYEH